MEAHRIRKRSASLILSALLISLVTSCASAVSGAPLARSDIKAALNLPTPRVQVDLCAVLQKSDVHTGTYADAYSCKGTTKLPGNKSGTIELYFFSRMPEDSKAETTSIGNYITRVEKVEKPSASCLIDMPLAAGGYIEAIVATLGEDLGNCVDIAEPVINIFSLLEKESIVFPETAPLLRLEMCKAIPAQAISQATGQAVDKTTPINGEHNCEWKLANNIQAETDISYGIPMDSVSGDGLLRENISGKVVSINPDAQGDCFVNWTQRNGPKGAENVRLIVSGGQGQEQLATCRALATAIIPHLPN